MLRIKIGLKNMTHVQLRSFARNHQSAIAGSADFPAPTPSTADYDALLAAYDARIGEIVQREIELAALRAQRDDLRLEMEQMVTSRSRYVAIAAQGDEAKVVSVGFALQGRATPTHELDAPQNVVARTGRNPGEALVRSRAVRQARGYLYEYREEPDSGTPGPWQPARLGSRCSLLLEELLPHTRYAFRMMPFGPNNLKGPWSDIAHCYTG